MLIVNVRCKRCGGNLYIERNIEGDTLKCLACGFERDIPVEVKPVPVITQNEWEAPVKEESITQEVIKNMKKVVLVSDEELEKQKEAIVADYMNPAITLAQTLVKWHIQSTRWHDLKIKWNVPSKGKGKHHYKPASKSVAKLPEKLPATSTCAKTQTEMIPVDQIKQMLSDIEKRLATLDQGIGDLLNRGYIDEPMKAKIVAAAIDYYTGPGITKEDRGKKVLAIVQAIEGV